VGSEMCIRDRAYVMPNQKEEFKFV
jgi:hypothetical protein